MSLLCNCVLIYKVKYYLFEGLQVLVVQVGGEHLCENQCNLDAQFYRLGFLHNYGLFAIRVQNVIFPG